MIKHGLKIKSTLFLLSLLFLVCQITAALPLVPEEITIVDALRIAQYAIGITLPPATDLSWADVNRDGQLDIVDALIVARYTVGLITVIPLTPAYPVPEPLTNWSKLMITEPLAVSGLLIANTVEGGFITAGTINDGQSVANDIIVTKFNLNGEISWHRIIRGIDAEIPHLIEQTADYGYIIAGGINKASGQMVGGFVIKLNSTGIIMWNRKYDTAHITSCHQTTDRDIVLLAPKTGDAGAGIEWGVLKLQSDGSQALYKTYTDLEMHIYVLTSINETSDGGFILGGKTINDNTINTDEWIARLDNNGEILWQKVIGLAEVETPVAVMETPDGGYLTAGDTVPTNFNGIGDYWVVKLDSSGNLIWQRLYSTSMKNSIQTAINSGDGGYIIAGNTSDWTGNTPATSWMLKIGDQGEIIWQNNYGSSGNWVRGIIKTADDDFILSGHYAAAELTQPGSSAPWIFKVTADGFCHRLTYNTNITPVETSSILYNVNAFAVESIIPEQMRNYTEDTTTLSMLTQDISE